MFSSWVCQILSYSLFWENPRNSCFRPRGCYNIYHITVLYICTPTRGFHPKDENPLTNASLAAYGVGPPEHLSSCGTPGGRAATGCWRGCFNRMPFNFNRHSAATGGRSLTLPPMWAGTLPHKRPLLVGVLHILGVMIPYRPFPGDMVFRCGGVSVRLRSLSCGREPYGSPTNAPLLLEVRYMIAACGYYTTGAKRRCGIF